VELVEVDAAAAKRVLRNIESVELEETGAK
jgi:hypothetical protein